MFNFVCNYKVNLFPSPFQMMNLEKKKLSYIWVNMVLQQKVIEETTTEGAKWILQETTTESAKWILWETTTESAKWILQETTTESAKWIL